MILQIDAFSTRLNFLNWFKHMTHATVYIIFFISIKNVKYWRGGSIKAEFIYLFQHQPQGQLYIKY